MLAPSESDAFLRLKNAGIQPSSQRLAIANYVLFTKEHPSAEQVMAQVVDAEPLVSRATVYNTLNLFVQRGLLKELHICDGHAVFDPEMSPHHHFLDVETGEIFDVDAPHPPRDWAAQLALGDAEIHDVQVILRGRRRAAGERPGPKREPEN